MNRRCTALGALILALVLAGARAHAAPPTVVPSPGYDARLEEQRKAARSAQPAPPVGRARRHPGKRMH
jgi:hypothetical protein